MKYEKCPYGSCPAWEYCITNNVRCFNSYRAELHQAWGSLMNTVGWTRFKELLLFDIPKAIINLGIGMGQRLLDI